MHSIPEIEFEEVTGRDGNLGLITLTRPQVLNALNHEMFIAMNKQLSEWEEANHIKAVVIRAAEGRAFCAGGDIRSAYQRKNEGDAELSNFFRDEYQLNQHIYHYLKPYIALMDGITMGGGVGISVHASHRVATERLIFAMPETGIGFYPDVGATYVLSHLPDHMGMYLGLTGARISLNDCRALELIDYGVKPDCFAELIYKLADTSLTNDSNAVIDNIIQEFSLPSSESALLQHREKISHCFRLESVEAIVHALEIHTDPWCREVASNLKTKSPTSLKVTFRAINEAKTLDFDECMQIEYRLTSRFLEGHDFFEGIRAVLVDKDQKPHWKPAKLDEITAIDIKKYFAPLEKELFALNPE
ncbi:MAG: enoyl-CoA hydratase/isomerase family protein [Gammaproteobacteria bacterium]